MYTFFPDMYFLNLRQAQTFSSSVFANRSPRYAIDGSMWSGDKVSHCFSSQVQMAPWWIVELDKHYEIESVLFQSCKCCLFSI